MFVALLIELALWWLTPKLPIRYFRPAGWCALFIGGVTIVYLCVNTVLAGKPAIALWTATLLQVYVVGTAAWLAWKNSKPF